MSNNINGKDLLNRTDAGKLAKLLDSLDNKDGKQDGKISATIWNQFVADKGGKEVKNFITTKSAMNSITTYLVRNAKAQGTTVKDLVAQWLECPLPEEKEAMQEQDATPEAQPETQPESQPVPKKEPEREAEPLNIPVQAQGGAVINGKTIVINQPDLTPVNVTPVIIEEAHVQNEPETVDPEVAKQKLQDVYGAGYGTSIHQEENGTFTVNSSSRDQRSIMRHRYASDGVTPIITQAEVPLGRYGNVIATIRYDEKGFAKSKEFPIQICKYIKKQPFEVAVRDYIANDNTPDRPIIQKELKNSKGELIVSFRNGKFYNKKGKEVSPEKATELIAKNNKGYLQFVEQYSMSTPGVVKPEIPFEEPENTVEEVAAPAEQNSAFKVEPMAYRRPDGTLVEPQQQAQQAAVPKQEASEPKPADEASAPIAAEEAAPVRNSAPAEDAAPVEETAENNQFFNKLGEKLKQNPHQAGTYEYYEYQMEALVKVLETASHSLPWREKAQMELLVESMKDDLKNYQSIMDNWTDGYKWDAWKTGNGTTFTHVEAITLTNGRRAYKSDQGVFYPARDGNIGGDKVENKKLIP